MQTDAPLSLVVFSTPLGWCGLLGRPQRGEPMVSRLWIGHRTAARVRSAAGSTPEGAAREADWCCELRERIAAYCAGAPVDFEDVAVSPQPGSAFRQRVLTQVRRIPFGATCTYREIAESAGSPRAARAVGNVMASNRVPLIIPCHRVLPSSGGLGGFSAPTGVQLKRRLLELERCPVVLP